MKGVLDLIDLKKLARNTKQNAVIDFPVIHIGKKVMERGIIIADKEDRNRYDNRNLPIIGTIGSGKLIYMNDMKEKNRNFLLG